MNESDLHKMLKSGGTYLDRYAQQHDEAVYWLRQVDERNNIDASRECLATAAIHSVLAVAAVFADIATRGIEISRSLQ